MRRAVFCGLGIILGYLAGALIGIAVIESFARTRDFTDAAASSELVAGPIGALIGAVIGWLLSRESKTRFDGRDLR